jgi:polyphenol oxidase
MLIPDWPAPANVRAVCSTRDGGVSRSPYDSLNLGTHVADDAAAVAENRRRFAAALDGARPVYLSQVHGRGVALLEAATPDGTEADACIARSAGPACTIMVADCLPVLFADAQGRAVAAAHAGWRGLAGEGGEGVLETVLKRFWAAGRMDTARAAIETIAWLGPCIGPKVFEVGDEVRAAFVANDAQAARHFQPHATPGKWLADLPGLARQRLAALGVTQVHGNDGSDAWCTVSNPSRFFSHRRDRVSGRFAAAVWLV